MKLESFSVTILGAGIGGLCAAIALHRLGATVRVYEKAPTLAPVGAGIVLWGNALCALGYLGVADVVRQAGATLQRGEIRNAQGQTLARSDPSALEQRYGVPTVAIHRAALHASLLAALPAGTVQFDHSGARFEQDDLSVRVYFANGQSTRSDLLVGADGLHSVVRQQLFPEVKLRYAGYTAWRGVVETQDEAALGLTTETWGHGQRFGVVRVDKERVYWFATVNAPPGQTTPLLAQKAYLQAQFGHWHVPIPALLAATPAKTILHHDLYDFAPIPQWSAGRVTLLGDAAHPTTPNMGQGACMAIESAVALARSLETAPDLPTALQTYEARRHARTAWITQQSWRIGSVGQWHHPLACALRDLLMRLTPSATLQAQLAQVVDYDAAR